MPEAPAASNLASQSLSLSGRVALVTGGSRGIGRAAVECFAKLGANVVVNYVSDQRAADSAVHEAEAEGVGALAVQADVAKTEDAKRLVDATLGKFARL